MKIYNLSSENSLSMNSSGGQLLKWKIGDTYINGLSYNERLIQYLRFRPFCMDYEEQLNLTNNKTKLKVDVLKNYIRGLLYEMIDNGLPKKRANFIKALLDDRINYIEMK